MTSSTLSPSSTGTTFLTKDTTQSEWTTTSTAPITSTTQRPKDDPKFVKMKYCFDKNNRQIAQLLRILKQCGEEEEICCIIAKIKIDSASLRIQSPSWLD
ncbi:Hypothetical protein FKW44_002171 [Caligus rogercresseyi]|uniref:Uncharacterized protein n=1 Tax=Caligus rogercresseyi TaxID=217165 RepID=A0A7T8KK59_CALRO|nr:Hypothetical protein FKW44_002171 [Caligus rogercresseyi]